MIRVKPIEWGEEQAPNKECGYNHVIGKSPLGEILITWKGWKDDPGYCTENWAFGCCCGSTLDETKRAVQEAYDRLVLSCIEEVTIDDVADIIVPPLTMRPLR